MILDCCQDGRKHHGAIFEKYSSHKFKKASAFVEAELTAGFELNLPTTLALTSTAIPSALEYHDEDSYTTESKKVVTYSGHSGMYSLN